MKISTRGRYGLRAMLELARRFGELPVLTRALAEREGLSPKYLHAQLTALKSAGLVYSIRGAGGGFVLARSPRQIRLSEVLHALEGPLSLVDCVADTRACDRSMRCQARRVWQELSGAIEDVLANITLEDLIAPEGSTHAGLREKKRSGSQRGLRPQPKAGRGLGGEQDLAGKTRNGTCSAQRKCGSSTLARTISRGHRSKGRRK